MMSETFWIDDPAQLHARVVGESRRSVLLGAYVGLRNELHYAFLDPSGAYTFSHRLAAGAKAQAVSREIPAFSWDEREMAQESCVVFEEPADDRPFRAVGGRMPQAIVASGHGLMHFVVGPVHAGIIEPGRFTFSSGGETVVHLDAQLGYAHRGVEKHCRGVHALEAARLIARICAGCSASRSFAYARGVEALAGVTLAPEIEFARLILAELERVYNHLADLAASASSAGWMPGSIMGMSLKERAMRLCAVASGHRLLFDAIVPGGVGAAVFADRAAFYSEFVTLDVEIRRFLARLFTHRSVLSRWRHAGVLRAEAARAFGAVGPAHRASGGQIDVRAYAPYGAYAEMRATPALAKRGDVMARCMVKHDELLDSLKLVQETWNRLGEAPLPSRIAFAPCEGVAIEAVEGPRGTETVMLHIAADGRLARLHVVSASFRTWPAVAFAMKENIVPDFPLVNKSFNLCYACVDR
jgi:formate hydrogenlyase subunit 5